MLLTAAPKNSARLLAFTALALLAGSACAQAAPSGVACPDSRAPGTYYRTFYLSHATGFREFRDVQTVLRNMLQGARIDGDSGPRALAICGTPAELELAQKIVSDLDHPTTAASSWRLTYTFTHDGSSRKAAFTVVLGADGEIKQGSRVPILTGTSSSGSDQVQYIDIGLSISAHVDDADGTPQLTTKVEQLEPSQEKPAASTGDPVLGQTILETETDLTPGKPLVLGTLNLPGGGQEEVSVTAEPIP